MPLLCRRSTSSAFRVGGHLNTVKLKWWVMTIYCYLPYCYFDIYIYTSCSVMWCCNNYVETYFVNVCVFFLIIVFLCLLMLWYAFGCSFLERLLFPSPFLIQLRVVKLWGSLAILICGGPHFNVCWLKWLKTEFSAAHIPFCIFLLDMCAWFSISVTTTMFSAQHPFCVLII
jgi:hypothetical protein